jgi:hypothetical protein
MDVIGILGFTGLAVILSFVLFKVLKSIAKLMIQTVISIIGLFLCYFFGILPINAVTIIVAAIGGIPGLLILIALKFIGIQV